MDDLARRQQSDADRQVIEVLTGREVEDLG